MLVGDEDGWVGAGWVPGLWLGCVEVDFYKDDWAWGHDQDRHESFRMRCQGLRDLLENEPSKRARTMKRLGVYGEVFTNRRGSS